MWSISIRRLATGSSPPAGKDMLPSSPSLSSKKGANFSIARSSSPITSVTWLVSMQPKRINSLLDLLIIWSASGTPSTEQSKRRSLFLTTSFSRTVAIRSQVLNLVIQIRMNSCLCLWVREKFCASTWSLTPSYSRKMGITRLRRLRNSV